ncbi:MAG: PTS lactose/cellobiose transporter subunit IIA [Tepidanaerobacteraceae bacterium]|jgi:PTS system cellobiose-specific IIA component|nr:PTS lactose/cellobiose transporter subunit IIA [Tepidanaerobacteraceae bacterium]
MEESKYDGAFQLITNAGNAKSAALMAIEAAREFDFAEAEARMQEAEAEMLEAHRAQTRMIQQEAGGAPVDVNIILVHAQDHLTMAMMAIKNAEEFIHLYKIMKRLMDKLAIENNLE